MRTEQAGGTSGNNGEVWKAVRHHGIRAHDAMLPEDYAGHDAGAVAEKAMCADAYRAFGEKRLVHDQSFVWIHFMAVIADVHVFADQAAVANFDGGDCRKTGEAADVHIVANGDTRLVFRLTVGIKGSEPAVAIDDAASSDADVTPPVYATRAIHVGTIAGANWARRPPQ